MNKKIILLGSMDTKGKEYSYLLKKIKKLINRLHLKLDTIVVDFGILGEPVDIVPDYKSQDVCKIVGSSIDFVRQAPSRGECLKRMEDCVVKFIEKLKSKDECHGIVALSGASGCTVIKSAMECLPLGFPKILATPLANGKKTFDLCIDSKDVMVMHSVFDIVGINEESKKIFNQIAGAVVGAMISSDSTEHCENAVGITVQGNTSEGVTYVKELLEKDNYEVIAFHASGVGGRAMEKMAEDDSFVGIIDYTTCEIFEDIVGGYQRGCGPERLTVAGKLNIPQVVVPGSIDYFDQGRPETIPEKWQNRRHYKHSGDITLVRLEAEELYSLGRIFAEKLNTSKPGKTAVVIPLKGFSIPDAPGQPFEDPDADYEFVKGLRSNLRDDIPIYEINAHVNDKKFALEVVNIFKSLM